MALPEGCKPGPWIWIRTDRYDELCDDNLDTILDDGSNCGEYGKVISKDSATAKLIAAAPDLYEALEEAYEYLRIGAGLGVPGFSGAMDKCVKAMAKARGEK